MKRTITMLMVALILLGMSGCGTGDSIETTIEETTIPQPTEIKLNEKVTVGELSFRITKFYYSDEFKTYITYSPNNGNSFGMVELTVYNDSRKEID